MKARINLPPETELLEIPPETVDEIYRIFRLMRYHGHTPTARAILKRYKITKTGYPAARALLADLGDVELRSVEWIAGTLNLSFRKHERD